MTLSTQPRRRGKIYCAPFCGGGCTWEEYQSARKSAAALALRLGKGWTTHVWENLGWHYSAISPSRAIKVHPSIIKGEFLAFFGDPDSAGGKWVSERFKNPAKAVAQVKAQARSEADRILALISLEEG